MPRRPLKLGAGVSRGRETRVAERLARSAVIRAGRGSGLSTPANPISPNVRGTSGAWAEEGAATATLRAAGAVVLTLMRGVAAEAGRAREATMAPDITMTAEVLLAGMAVCEIADEKDEAGLKAFGARWRPVFRLDTVRGPLHTLTRSAVGFGWETASGLHAGRSTEVVHHR